MNAAEALQRLKEGNQRFQQNETLLFTKMQAELRAELAQAQTPFAIILGCADSRVPPELIFDQTLGDLFTVRIAGNVASPAAIASIEYAVAKLGTRLLVVLGHSSCGAVKATLDHLNEPLDLTPSLTALVNTISPAITKTQTLDQAIAANVTHSRQTLTSQSSLLASTSNLQIIGATYSLETGVVTFDE
ncbi:MAG: carbonic anhydrase [Verrucomicrobiota bacterium]